MYSVMWSEHCSYKSLQGAPASSSARSPQRDAVGKLLVGIGENAGVVDIGDGCAVTFKVESHNHPSYVEPYQGAATGVGGIVRDILADGRPPGRGDGPAALRRRSTPPTPTGCCPASSPASAATATASACPTSAARSSSTPSLPRQPAGQRALRRRAAARGPPPRQGRAAPATWSSCSAPDRRRRHRRRLGARRRRPSTTSGPAKRPERPGRRPVHREAAHRVHASSSSPPSLVVGIQDLGGAGLSCATVRAGRPPATAACTSSSTGCRCATPSLAPEEILMSESQERMMAVVEPGDVDAFLAICAQVGRRRPPSIGEVTDGDRLRDRLARRARRRRAAALVAHDGPVYDRPFARPGLAGRAAGRRRRGAAAARRPATSCARPLLRLVASARTCATSPGSPTSTTATCTATPCSPSPRTPAWSASTRRPASASRSPPTATAGSPSSTRTPARSSRWPRPTATSPPPAPRRSPSPTASTSARPRTRP